MSAALLDRRALLLGLSGIAIGGCTCAGEPERSPEPPPQSSGLWRDISFDADADSQDGERALLFAPEGAPALPLLVALHGRGESGRGLAVGARGWRDDYGLERVHERLRAPPLTSADLRGFVDPERLSRLNASLAREPYRGLCVATPYTPDLADRFVSGARGFGRFVTERLLPRARAELGGAWDRASTAIDGVSMGGRLALFVGLSYPEVFGAVGAMQPAISVGEAGLIADLAKAANARAKVLLRLVSSSGDPFLPAVRAASERLTAAGVAHELLVVPGPHDYVWNRGPGGIEMLLGHERALRGLPPP